MIFKRLLTSDIKRIHNIMLSNRREMPSYSQLPEELNSKNWHWKGKDFPRVWALIEFGRYVKKYNLQSKKLMLLNQSDPELEYISHDKIVLLEYNLETGENDLHNLNLKEKDFDFIFINQTLEHLYNPILCLRNLYDHMVEDGYLYANVPAVNIPHDTPVHFFTGFTAVGLGAICETAGFRVLEIGQWGSLEYIKKIFSHQDWFDYTEVKHGNDVKCPVICWVLAKKEK